MKRIQKAFLAATFLAGMAISVPKKVWTQAPVLIYGSSNGAPQLIKSTSNALWVSLTQLPGGASTGAAKPCTLAASTGSAAGVGNVTGAATTAFRYQIPANTFSASHYGTLIKLSAGGSFAANTNTGKTIQVRAGASGIDATGGTLIASVPAGAYNGGAWNIDNSKLIGISSNVQRGLNSSYSNQGVTPIHFDTALTLTEANPNDVILVVFSNSASGASDDILARQFSVEVCSI